MKRQQNRSAKKGSGREPQKTALHLTSELARTWLITVINPVLQGLRQEEVWLTRKNWTWRYSTGTFEHLWPLIEYVDPIYRDNFSEFCGWYEKAAQAIKAHDSAAGELAAACNMAFRRLFETPDFFAAVAEANATAAKKGIRIEEARGAVPSDQWSSLIAEYLINNVRALPEYYATAAFWKEASEIVLRVRNAQSLREQFDALDQAGLKLLQAAERAEETLVSIRQTYTRKFGLPPVPLPNQSPPPSHSAYPPIYEHRQHV